MAKVIRKILVWLYDNVLTPASNDSYGRVQSAGIMTNDGVASEIKEEGSEYQIETLGEILDRADRIRRKALTRGYTVHTGFVNAHVGVQGAFTDKVFDPAQHKLVIKSSASAQLRKEIAELPVKIMGDAQTGTIIQSVKDSLTSEVNDTITPSDIVTITGNRLQIAGDAPTVGIFFISISDDTRHKVERIISNKNKELIVMTPALPAGDYRLEIITQYTNGSQLLKTPNEARFDEPLTVV